MASIYDIISATPDGGTAALPAGEFEGPAVIGRPMTLKGGNTTLWARHGAVLNVQSGGVSLEGLRVEITEGDAEETAVSTAYPVSVRNVEVFGSVSGFGAEDGVWAIPRTLELGELSPNDENTFLMTADIPAEAQISCSQSGITFTPNRLPAGRSEIKITVNAPGTAGILYTEVLLESKFKRRIYVSGRFAAGAEAARDREVFCAAPVDRSTEGILKSEAPKSIGVPNEPLSTPDFKSSAALKQPSVTPSPSFLAAGAPSAGGQAAGAPRTALPLEVMRGQRIPAAQVNNNFKICFSGIKHGEIEVDPYVFLLDESNKCLGDKWLVFFGNYESPDGSVRYIPDSGDIIINTAKIAPGVKHVVVTYSVYSGNNFKNFSLIEAPLLQLYSASGSEPYGEVYCSFPVNGLTSEVTVVGIDVYMHKDDWRIFFVGSGYRYGLARLCNNYGLEVAE